MKRLNHPFMLIAAFVVAMVVLFARPAPCANVAHGPPTMVQALIPEIGGSSNPAGDALVASITIDPMIPKLGVEVAIPVIYETVEGYQISASMFDDTGQIAAQAQNGSATIAANTDMIAAYAFTVPTHLYFDRLDMENSVVAKPAAAAVLEVAYYVIWLSEESIASLRPAGDTTDVIDDTVSAALAAWNPSNWTGDENTGPPRVDCDIGSSAASYLGVNPFDRLGLCDVQQRE